MITKEEALKGAFAAIECAKKGEKHEQLNNLINKTIKRASQEAAFIASFYPKKPIIQCISSELADPYPENLRNRFRGD